MNNPGIYQLFVYGSLRSGFKSPAYEYISRFFHLAGEGKVKGVMADLGEYPAAVPSNDGLIVGELYTIKEVDEFSWAIAQLDDYEGVIVEHGEQPLYYRAVTEVFIHDRTVPAWVYWYNGDISGKPVIASGDILEYISRK
jgi:gamma-glutamylcyclotransferase (GGCT)/AIG2-like uncharacterized protein YtfP